MRKIRFRGKGFETGDWYYGDLIHDDLDFDTDLLFIRHNSKIHSRYINVDVISETVGEYVEVLDAYEGDILMGTEYKHGIPQYSWYGVVAYNEEKSRIMILDTHDKDWYEVDDYSFEDIVGNTTDDPQLLEVR